MIFGGGDESIGFWAEKTDERREMRDATVEVTKYVDGA